MAPTAHRSRRSACRCASPTSRRRYEMRVASRILVLCAFWSNAWSADATSVGADPQGWLAGASRVDITPPAFAPGASEFALCPPTLDGPTPFALEEPYLDADGSG